MQIKLAFSTAILGTITIALAGYAKTSISSHDLSGIQNLSCPALTGERTTATLNVGALPADSAEANSLLGILAMCNGYGYGGYSAGSDSALFNRYPIPQTPQAAAEFDQLPQDRVDLTELDNL